MNRITIRIKLQRWLVVVGLALQASAFAQVVTYVDQGGTPRKIEIQGEKVFLIDSDRMRGPAPDGVYKNYDGKVILVSKGVLVNVPQ